MRVEGLISDATRGRPGAVSEGLWTRKTVASPASESPPASFSPSSALSTLFQPVPTAVLLNT